MSKTVVAASGLFALAGAEARACHIHHDTRTHSGTETTASVHPSASTHFADLQKSWDHQYSTPPSVVPTVMAAKPAAEVLTPPSTTVATASTGHPTGSNCTPPPPPPTCDGPMMTKTPPTTPGINPAAALLAPSSIQAAPEPSTVLSALALVGAFAWRRRSSRPKA